MLVIILRRAGEAGDDVFVGLSGGKLREPEAQPARIAGTAEVVEVVVVNELRVVLLASGREKGISPNSTLA